MLTGKYLPRCIHILWNQGARRLNVLCHLFDHVWRGIMVKRCKYFQVARRRAKV